MELNIKKITASLLSLLLVFSLLSSTTFAAKEEVSLQVNGELIEFNSHEPIIDSGLTLVPLEPLFQALDITLEQNATEQQVTGTKEGLVLQLQNGVKSAIVNGESVELISEPKIINEVTYISARFIAEASGYEVRWDATTRTVFLETKGVTAGGRGFLWEVEKGGNKVYLLGSMHIADNSFYPLHSSMEDAFDEADYLGVEVDVSKSADPQIQELVLSLGTYQDGTTLKDHISEATYATIGGILEEFEAPKNSLDQFKPWVVESTLTSLQAAKSGYEGQIGIDLYFITQAMENKTPIIELESFESQLSMFNNFSTELQEKTLKDTLDNFHTISDSVDKMADMWKDGNDAALLELTKEMAVNEEYNKAMLIDRNIAMANKIEGYLNGSNQEVYLIVVGAAHMLDDTGIVSLLQNKGFVVTRK
ncbi:TraB/GumN family protein [Paenibacillus crassostreae]|uniref:TraB/GumN family protein n=1 Tax=Paenibacillus crassostreae TaxID=1763538 RepID=UPI003AADEB30